MSLELILTKQQFEQLKDTKPSQRGYVLATRKKNVLKANEIIAGIDGDELIVDSELLTVIPKVICENEGYLPYINKENNAACFAEAVEILKVHRESKMNKFFGYGVIFDEAANFYYPKRVYYGWVEKQISNQAALSA